MVFNPQYSTLTYYSQDHTILQKTVLGHFEYSKKIPQKLKNEEDFYRRKALKKDPPV